MKRILGAVAVVFVLLVALGAIAIYQQVHDLKVEQVTEDISVIYGLGSNVGILRTDEGAVVVDTMSFRSQGSRVHEISESLAGPLQAVINTHYHWDHTRGNVAFPSGARFVSTERTRAYLDVLDAEYWAGAEGMLPNETFRNERVMKIGGKTLRLVHPGRGHTDGDLVVLFVEDRVIHTGDLFFNGRYPNIDLEAGGSVRDWVATIDRILELDFEQVIPGHGPVTDRDGLREFQSFMRQLAAAGEQALRQGWTLDQMKRDAELDKDAGYESMEIPFLMRLDRDFVLRRAWEEATGQFERVVLPEASP